MSRARTRSEGAMQQISALRSSQQQGAASIAAASNTKKVSEETAQVAADLAAADIGGISATQADHEARLQALETP